MQSVASATEELSSSVNEISRQVQHSVMRLDRPPRLTTASGRCPKREQHRRTCGVARKDTEQVGSTNDLIDGAAADGPNEPAMVRSIRDAGFVLNASPLS